MFSISRSNPEEDVIDRAAENMLKILKARVEPIQEIEKEQTFLRDEPQKMSMPGLLRRASSLAISKEGTKDQDLSELLNIAKSVC